MYVTLKSFKWRFGIYFPSVESLEGKQAQAFVKAVAERSDNRLQRPRILIMGVAYKKNVSVMR